MGPDRIGDVDEDEDVQEQRANAIAIAFPHEGKLREARAGTSERIERYERLLVPREM